MPDKLHTEPLAPGWRVSEPDANGYCEIRMPDDFLAIRWNAEWLVEHGQPVPARSLRKGDKVRWSDRGSKCEVEVVAPEPDNGGCIVVVTPGGGYRLALLAAVERVEP